ncbi:MFS transporter [Woeseiaceae bacterium]|jgi:OPA family sugar phosphate sensor protein UhpC-like MFS transporter|nr:MFS transporter [Woeseiaceae bacterium]|tara:strand:- start:685 stop:1968 length:1284 start_codon:yes stop_codon:yes gene_type:complete
MTIKDIDLLYQKHRIRVLLAITLGYGFIYTCRLGLSIVKKPLIDAGIFTIDELGMIGAALFYGYACGKFINGFLADYISPRVFFSLSIFLAALINIMMGITTYLWVATLLWLLNGFFQGMAAPTSVVSITNWFSYRERGRCYGIWNASHSIGEGFTFYIIAAIVAAYGWQWGFITPGILCIAVAAWAFSFLKDKPSTLGLPPINVWKNEDVRETNESPTWATQKVMFGIKAIWVVALASAMMYITRYAINSWGILYLQEARGYSLTEAAFFLSINTFAGIFGSIAYGFISDNFFNARRPPANLIFAIIEIGALLLIFYGPSDEWIQLIAFACYGFTLSGLMASLGGLFAVDIAPKGATGAAMGFVGIFSYLGAAIQENISAALISNNIKMIQDERIYNFDAVILFWIGSSIISLILAASLWKTKVTK